MGILKTFWGYRGFILGSVQREFQANYKNSLLGAAWTVIRPLVMIIVYTVVFSQIMSSKLPGVESEFAYSIYLCAGVLTCCVVIFVLEGLVGTLRCLVCSIQLTFSQKTERHVVPPGLHYTT